MKALTVEKAQEIRAGKGHYHWICRDWANFTSKAYSSYAAAGAAADAHVAKYPAHADKVRLVCSTVKRVVVSNRNKQIQRGLDIQPSLYLERRKVI